MSIHNRETAETIQEAVDVLREHNHFELADKLAAIAKRLRAEVLQYERDLDAMEREAKLKDQKKKASSEKAALTRQKRKEFDVKTYQIVSADQETYRKKCLDYVVPTLSRSPRILPLRRNDETGAVWADLEDIDGNPPPEDDEPCIMRAAEMFGYVKRNISGKQYIEEV
ncbi:MAG: hypothetical protein OXG15_02450 [Gammaproteobacteria bacterium]|nr:hypothetical protein [Gammaproteobacteria bacterium]